MSDLSGRHVLKHVVHRIGVDMRYVQAIEERRELLE